MNPSGPYTVDLECLSTGFSMNRCISSTPNLPHEREERVEVPSKHE